MSRPKPDGFTLLLRYGGLLLALACLVMMLLPLMKG